MIYTRIEEDFDHAWLLIQTRFNCQKTILNYLKKQYMPWKEEWAHCFINRNLNFSQRTMSPTETANRGVKSYLVNRNSSLFKLNKAIEMILKNKQHTFDMTVASQKIHLQHVTIQG